jgi:hypothetical protein
MEQLGSIPEKLPVCNFRYSLYNFLVRQSASKEAMKRPAINIHVLDKICVQTTAITTRLLGSREECEQADTPNPTALRVQVIITTFLVIPVIF